MNVKGEYFFCFSYHIHPALGQAKLESLKNHELARGYLSILTCISFLLILPAFMITINTSKEIYPHDIDTGIFLNEHSLNMGSNIIIYRASTTSASWAYYYLPETSFQNITEDSYYHREEFWKNVNMLVATFGQKQHDENKDLIFVIDEQMYNSAERLLGITPNDPRWGVLQNILSNQLLFYNNGFTQMYTSRICSEIEN